MKNKKFQDLKKRLERLERGTYNEEEADHLIYDLIEPSKGSSQYRRLLQRAYKVKEVAEASPSSKRKPEPKSGPMRGLGSVLPKGLTSSPELRGGNKTVSGGLPGSRR